MIELLLILVLLFTKHFIVDFPLQTKFQWSNKGTYGHPGGALHALLHYFGTFLVLIWFGPIHTAILLAFADGVIHYHIDWAKMKLNAMMQWAPNTHEQFWWLLGLDQYLHALTYIGLVYFYLK
jgi:Protein of unknown function (DUF3307)